VPPASQQQLAACRIQPSHITSQLHTILHASNVFHNHLTSAAMPSGSATAAAPLLPSQQPRGAVLSGGYAGLPLDLPVKYVKGGFVGPDDPRRHLQGEFTLTALQVGVGGRLDGNIHSY
jgi:hypothetical protein